MTIFGLDVSNQQHGLDLKLAVDQGYRFVTARLLSYPHGTAVTVDPSWTGFRDQAKALRLPFAGYVLPHTRVPLAEQVDAARAAIGDRTIPIMIDWEPDGDSIPSLAYAAQVWDDLRLAGLNPRSIYAPRWYWHERGEPVLTVRSWRLVSSDYGNNAAGYASDVYQGDSWRGWAIYGGLPPSMCQFGSRITLDGWPVPLDGDAYRGSVADLVRSGMVTGWPQTPSTSGDTVDAADVWNYPIPNLAGTATYSARVRLLDVETDLDAVKTEQAAQRALLDRIVAKLDA